MEIDPLIIQEAEIRKAALIQAVSIDHSLLSKDKLISTEATIERAELFYKFLIDNR